MKLSFVEAKVSVPFANPAVRTIRRIFGLSLSVCVLLSVSQAFAHDQLFENPILVAEENPTADILENGIASLVMPPGISGELHDSRKPAGEAKSANSSLKINLPVTKFKLKNGLTVLLHEDHTVPLVSYHTWFKVGSRDEAPGITGSAHMLEHMMFKGSKNYPGKSFDQILHQNGITNNAFTNYDYTGYYESLPSSKLEMMMQIEVDRMASLDLKPEDLLSERDVVKEERRLRVDNNPQGVMMETVMGTVYKKSNYRWPIIGHMKDISDFQIDTLRKFHSTYYVPNNAILVIAGDFKTGDVKRMVEKYYGSLEQRPLPERNYAKENPQTVQRNATVRRDVQARSVTVAFKGTANAHEDMYALDLASSVLGNGTSSRLYKRMVYQKQSATSAYAYHSGMQDDGVFAVGLNLKPGIAVQENLELVYQEIWKLRNKIISEQELANAKTQLMKDMVDGLTTVDGKARAMAVNEIMTGSYENLFKDLDRYNAVTADQIKAVANKYLNQTQRSVIVLEPRAKAEAVPTATAETTTEAPAAAVETAAAPTAAPAAAPVKTEKE
jgi:zinc protease